MTIEREALLFLIDRVEAIQEQQERDSVTLIQIETALRSAPAGATIDDHLRNAKQIVIARRAPGIERTIAGLIQKLKES